MQETQEMQMQSRGQEDPLEEVMATHSSILAWEILQTEEPGGLSSMGALRVRHYWTRMHLALCFPCIVSSRNQVFNKHY